MDGMVNGGGLRSVVGLVGRTGSGKSTLGRALVDAVRASQAVAMSDVLRQLAGSECFRGALVAGSQTPGRGDTWVPSTSMSRDQLAVFGQQVVDSDVAGLCRFTLERSRPTTEVLIVDGVRHETFATELSRQLHPTPLFLVRVHLDNNARHQRLRARGRSSADIEHADAHPTENDLWARRLADVVVDGAAPTGQAVRDVAALLAMPRSQP